MSEMFQLSIYQRNRYQKPLLVLICLVCLFVRLQGNSKTYEVSWSFQEISEMTQESNDFILWTIKEHITPKMVFFSIVSRIIQNYKAELHENFRDALSSYKDQIMNVLSKCIPPPMNVL